MKETGKGEEMKLQPHQTRVVIERDELDEKVKKLDDFIGSEIFFGLPEVDRALMIDQQRAMCLYLSILSQRIDRF